MNIAKLEQLADEYWRLSESEKQEWAKAHPEIQELFAGFGKWAIVHWDRLVIWDGEIVRSYIDWHKNN